MIGVMDALKIDGACSTSWEEDVPCFVLMVASNQVDTEWEIQPDFLRVYSSILITSNSLLLLWNHRFHSLTPVAQVAQAGRCT